MSELINELRSGFDNEPSSLHREAERLNDLCERAADALEIRQMNVFQKIHAVSSEIGRVAMSLNVDTGNNKSYKAISINDVVDALIPLIEKYRLAIVPGDKTIIQSDQITTTTKFGEKQQFFVRVAAKYLIVNIDNPADSVITGGYGDGIDPGDKATGKAITYARKYALIDAFNLSKGDDPDEKASEEYQKIQVCSPEDVQKIMSLYTDKEIGTMLKRMKKSNLCESSVEQAARMIAKRDQSLVKSEVETF